MKNIFIFALALATSFAAKAEITVSPGSVYFGYVKINSGFPSQTVSIFNESNKSEQISVSVGCFQDISAYNYCGGLLAAYGSCQIVVNFRPEHIGTQSCYITVQSFSGDYASVSVSGTGY